jgi:hypothetical protein
VDCKKGLKWNLLLGALLAVNVEAPIFSSSVAFKFLKSTIFSEKYKQMSLTKSDDYASQLPQKCVTKWCSLFFRNGFWREF